MGDAVGGCVDPGQAWRLRQQLLGLQLAELRERAPGRLIAVAELARRRQRIEAVDLGILVGRLVGMDYDLVAGLPAFDTDTHLPDDPGRVRAADVVTPLGMIAIGEDRDRVGQRGPNAVEVEARSHHPHDHLERPGLGDLDLLDLVGGGEVALPLRAEHPGGHRLRQLAGLDPEGRQCKPGGSHDGAGGSCLSHDMTPHSSSAYRCASIASSTALHCSREWTLRHSLGSNDGGGSSCVDCEPTNSAHSSRDITSRQSRGSETSCDGRLIRCCFDLAEALLPIDPRRASALGLLRASLSIRTGT